MDNAKTRILRSSGLTSDATRLMSNARATLHGQRIKHANGVSFAAPGGKSRTTTTTLANGDSLSYLDSAGDEQPGYADIGDAARAEYEMRRAGKRTSLAEEALRKARRKAHVARGLSDETALAITRMTDEDLDTARHGMDGEDLDDADVGTDDDDDDNDARADALQRESQMRFEQGAAMGDSADTEDGRRRRSDAHIANGVSNAEAKRMSELSDEDLADELAACDSDQDDADDAELEDDAELSRGRVELSRSSGDVRIMFPKGAA